MHCQNNIKNGKLPANHDKKAECSCCMKRFASVKAFDEHGCPGHIAQVSNGQYAAAVASRIFQKLEIQRKQGAGVEQLEASILKVQQVMARLDQQPDDLRQMFQELEQRGLGTQEYLIQALQLMFCPKEPKHKQGGAPADVLLLASPNPGAGVASAMTDASSKALPEYGFEVPVSAPGTVEPIVRAGIEIDSAKVGTLPLGCMFWPQEVATNSAGTRRVRLDEPLVGWVSWKGALLKAVELPPTFEVVATEVSVHAGVELDSMTVGSLPLHCMFKSTELGLASGTRRVRLIEPIDGWVSWTETALNPIRTQLGAAIGPPGTGLVEPSDSQAEKSAAGKRPIEDPASPPAVSKKLNTTQSPPVVVHAAAASAAATSAAALPLMASPYAGNVPNEASTNRVHVTPTSDFKLLWDSSKKVGHDESTCAHCLEKTRAGKAPVHHDKKGECTACKQRFHSTKAYGEHSCAGHIPATPAIQSPHGLGPSPMHTFLN
jgi:hypothetical protein